MRISFVLPSWVRRPGGGLRIAYEYANRLSRRGHEVRVVHLDLTLGGSPLRRLRRATAFALWRRGWQAWFLLDRDVHPSRAHPERPELLPTADVLVAIGWQSARFIHRAPATAGRQNYLIQGYMATWEGRPGEVDEVWRLPIRKIVISRALEAKVREVCGPDTPVERVTNGIAFDTFRVRVPIDERDSNRVSMVFHHALYRGAADGVAALELAREMRPGLQAIVFGIEAPAEPLPAWIDFRLLPPDVAGVYNESAIFLHTSRAEAWPLPPAEAMACGCALVATANEGVTEYAVDGSNALIVPLNDIEATASAIVRLVDDRDLRMRLARQGLHDISDYGWDKSVIKLEEILARR